MIDICYAHSTNEIQEIQSIQDVLRYYISEEEQNVSFCEKLPHCGKAIDTLAQRLKLLNQLLSEYPREVHCHKNIRTYQGKITHCQVGYCIDAPESIVRYIKQIIIAVSNTKDDFSEPMVHTFEMEPMLSVEWFGNELCDELIDNSRGTEILAYVDANGVVIKLEPENRYTKI